MKKFSIIFVTLLTVITVYGAKDELQTILHKGGLLGSATDAKIDSEKVVNQEEYIDLNNKNKEEVIAPGPLKVFRNILNYNSDLDSQRVIDETNKVRIENGLAISLVYNEKLSLSAMNKLDDMFTRQYFEHTSPIGVKIDTLVKSEGYEFIVIGENLALGNFKDEKDLVDAWMNSEPHKENILNNRYKDIGIAVKKGTFEGKNVWIAVQHFGLYIDECPSIDSVLKAQIIKDQKELETQNTKLEELKSIIDANTDDTTNEYKANVNEYNKLAKEYNTHVLDTRNEIKTFNNQVKVFNSCASGN